MKSFFKKAAYIFFFSVTLVPNAIVADDGDSWKYGFSIYGWFPDISGKTSFPDGSGGDFTVPIQDILDNLSFTFQGSFDARKGMWGLYTDAIYLDLGKSRSFDDGGAIGENEWPTGLNAKLKLDMKSLIWTTAGYFRVVDQPEMSFDVLAGLRYLDIDQELSWTFSGNIAELPLAGPEGKARAGINNWDVIFGMRGRFMFGQENNWFIPYYLDMGAGDSDFTWQAAGGFGYAFNWGELSAVWRYLSYEQPSDKVISDMEFSGPAIGAVFRW